MSEPRVKFIKLKDSMIVHYGVTTVTVHADSYLFDKLEAAFAEEDYDKVYALLEEKNRKKIKNMLQLNKKHDDDVP